MQIMTINFGEYVLKHSQPLTLDAIWYNWIRIWQSNLKSIGFHSSLFCTRSTTVIPVSHLPNIYSFFCSGIWCPSVDADSVSWSSEPNHTYLTIFLPASVFLLQHFKKWRLFNLSCFAETLSTRTSTAIIKLVLTPSPIIFPFLQLNLHLSLFCLIKPM